MSVPVFESQVMTLANQILQAIHPQLVNLTDFGWNATTGANYEGVYNGGGLGANDKPTNAQMTQSQMNNVITAFNVLKAAIEDNSGALAKVKGT